MLRQNCPDRPFHHNFQFFYPLPRLISRTFAISTMATDRQPPSVDYRLSIPHPVDSPTWAHSVTTALDGEPYEPSPFDYSPAVSFALSTELDAHFPPGFTISAPLSGLAMDVRRVQSGQTPSSSPASAMDLQGIRISEDARRARDASRALVYRISYLRSKLTKPPYNYTLALVTLGDFVTMPDQSPSGMAEEVRAEWMKHALEGFYLKRYAWLADEIVRLEYLEALGNARANETDLSPSLAEFFDDMVRRASEGVYVRRI